MPLLFTAIAFLNFVQECDSLVLVDRVTPVKVVAFNKDDCTFCTSIEILLVSFEPAVNRRLLADKELNFEINLNLCSSIDHKSCQDDVDHYEYNATNCAEHNWSEVLSEEDFSSGRVQSRDSGSIVLGQVRHALLLLFWSLLDAAEVTLLLGEELSSAADD